MSKTFLLDLLERAAKTFAQALVAILGAGAADLISVPWLGALSAAGMAALLSVLTSVASSQWGDQKTASLVKPVEPPTEGARPVRLHVDADSGSSPINLLRAEARRRGIKPEDVF